MLTVVSYRSRDHWQKYDKEEEGVETIVSLNTELEVAIPYPQLWWLTATTVAERQRPSLPEPLDLNIGKEYRQLSIRFWTKRMYAAIMLVKREEEKQQQKIGEGQMNYPDYHGLEGLLRN